MRCPIVPCRLDGLSESVFKSLKARALGDFRHGLKFHSYGSADRRDVLRGGVYFLEFLAFEVGNQRILKDLSNKIGKEGLEIFVERLDVGIGSGHCCFQRGFATSWGDGLVCGFAAWGGLIEVDPCRARRLHPGVVGR
jgi:hypothetical protein